MRVSLAHYLLQGPSRSLHILPPLLSISIHPGKKNVSDGKNNKNNNNKKGKVRNRGVWSVSSSYALDDEKKIILEKFNIRDGFVKWNPSVWIHPPGRCGRAGGGLRTVEWFTDEVTSPCRQMLSIPHPPPPPPSPATITAPHPLCPWDRDRPPVPLMLPFPCCSAFSVFRVTLNTLNWWQWHQFSLYLVHGPAFLPHLHESWPINPTGGESPQLHILGDNSQISQKYIK